MAWKVRPLAPSTAAVYTSPDADGVHAENPALVAMPGGNLVAAFDQSGPGVKHLTGPKGRDPQSSHWMQGKVLVSRDRGETWTVRKEFTFGRPCLFRDGQTVYLFGLRGGVQVMKSADGGTTWSNPASLSAPAATGDAVYLHSPTRPLAAGDHVYMALLRLTDAAYRGDPVSTLALELWRARQGADLTDRRNWTLLGDTPAFRDWVPAHAFDGAGAPFFKVPDAQADVDLGNRRWAGRPGWRDPWVLRIEDAAHTWHDPKGQTLLIVASLRAHRSNLAMAVLARIDDEGRADFRAPAAPSGRRFGMLPVPGGHQAFDLFHDEVSGLYWLTSNLVTDSLCRVGDLPRERSGLPSDECHRLQLCFSRNLVDWCLAGLIDAGAHAALTRMQPSAAVRGADLCVLYRAATEGRRNPLHTDEVRMALIPNFRELAY